MMGRARRAVVGRFAYPSAVFVELMEVFTNCQIQVLKKLAKQRQRLETKNRRKRRVEKENIGGKKGSRLVT